MPIRTIQRLTLGRAFALAAQRYWTAVFPVAHGVVRGLRARAEAIPDPVLRALAIQTQARKWDSQEGAAAFAAFTCARSRAAVAGLLVRLQAIYDYADTLMEQPNPDPARNSRELHKALLAALQPGIPHPDYYVYHGRCEDSGYLPELVEACRGAVAGLPSYPLVAGRVLRHARRIILYQSFINLPSQTSFPRIERWAAREGGVFSPELRWWELAAAAGSSLGLFALLAAAAEPSLTAGEADAIDALYWPWGGALHTLLDSFVDRDEDDATGQHNLLCHYASPDELRERLTLITSESSARAARIGNEHSLIVAAVASFYISDRRAWLPANRSTSTSLLGTLADLGAPTMVVLRARRIVRASARR